MSTLTAEEYYRERTDRNIGWITREEQEILRQSVVGIAGCGGMGGLLAATLVRVGIGEVRIADSEVFDISNLNRQFTARRSTVGKSKAYETLLDLEAIADDVKLISYPEGITATNVDTFTNGCTFICDEIEFWASAPRILLHQSARKQQIPVITCCSVGFGSRLFYFPPNGHTVEKMLDTTLIEATEFEERLRSGDASQREIDDVLSKILRTLVPELPQYTSNLETYNDRDTCVKRLTLEQKASIIGSNPPLATGLVANRVILQLLAQHGCSRDIPPLPEVPGYLYLDSAFGCMKQVYRENTHE
jgi:molybdopterin/thiamine biosynthesis adenylyltransferase